MSNPSKNNSAEPSKKSDKQKSLAQDWMVSAIPVAHPDETLAHVEASLHHKAKQYDSISYIYVTDENGLLRGVFSIKELFDKPNTQKVSDVMKTDPVAVFLKTQQERAALTALTHGIKAVPVVDKQRRLLGVIPSDNVLAILRQEETRDVLQLAGVKSDRIDISSLSARSLFLRRVPWLIIGLVGGIGAAMIIELFETTIELHVLIAAFIPAVVYIADAVGTQTQTLFIRSMAVEQKFSLSKYVLRESRIGLLLATSLGALGGLFVCLRWRENAIGLIIASSFFFAILIAVAVAMFLPWIFTKLKKDPAVASGPFASVLRDLTTLIIYFTIAEAILGRFTTP